MAGRQVGTTLQCRRCRRPKGGTRAQASAALLLQDLDWPPSLRGASTHVTSRRSKGGPNSVSVGEVLQVARKERLSALQTPLGFFDRRRARRADRSKRRSGEAYSGVRVGRVVVLLDELVELCLALLLELLDLGRRLLSSLFGSCKVRPNEGENVNRRSSRTLYPNEQITYRKTYLVEVVCAGGWVLVHLARLGRGKLS